MGLPDPDILDQLAKAAEEPDLVSRRSFLGQIAGATAGGIIALGNLVRRAEANSADRPKNGPSVEYKYDIAYITSPEIDDVLDYADDIERVLGPKVANQLEVMRVKDSGQFTLVYAREGDLDGGKRVSAKHTKLLTSDDLNPTAVVRSDLLEPLYNISYGVGKLEVLKKHFEVVSHILGADATNQLGIEQRRDGQYALVYKRYGDHDSSLRVAKHHSDLLCHTGISADVTRERNNDLVFGNSNMQDQEEIPRLQPKAPAKHAPSQIPHKPGENVPEVFHGGGLERAIESHIKALRRSGRLGADEDTSFVVYDLARNQKLVSINEDTPRQAASMIKVFVALAFFHEVEAGRQHYDAKARTQMQRMIQHSNNHSTNWFIHKLGGAARVNNILHQNYPQITPGVRMVESIPAGGRAYRNKATAHDYSRFLYALWNRDLPHSAEIQRVMALPKRSRIKSRAHAVPQRTFVANKTGSTAQLCGDMGILVAHDAAGRAHPYLIVGIIESGHHQSRYKPWINSRGNIIGEVSSLAYRGIVK